MLQVMTSDALFYKTVAYDMFISGWWFGTFLFSYFPFVGNNHPNRLIF